jgi:chromosome segregation ATPase
MQFGIQNLITIGIVLLLLIFFRLIDSKIRSIDRAKRYIDQWEKGLSSLIEEKTAFIRDFHIKFEVEKKAATELMRRIQSLTRDELEQKVQALTIIDERIREYDANLEELLQMTGRVQDNLNRLREESAYVENVEKKVMEINEKFDMAEGEIDALGEKLASIEENFEQDNTAALEKAIEAVISGARTAIVDMEAEAQTIGRKVEEHREAIDNLERGRVEKLARDEERIEKLLTEAVDRAGSRADRVEDAALTKLRDQAQERVSHIKTNFEEKIKTVQETVKTKIAEINEQIKESREEWKTETASIEARQKEYTANWKKDIHELDAFAKQVKEEWAEISHKTGQELIAAAERRLEEYRQVQEEQYKQLASIANDTTHLEEELRRSMQETVNRVNGDFARFEDEMHASWEGASNKMKDSWESASNEMKDSWESASNKMKDSWEGASNEMKNSWEGVSGEYTANLEALRQDLAGIEQELQGIKEKSFENVSKKLKGFEDDFLANLSRRSGEIDKQLEVWRNELDARLGEELEKAIKGQREKVVADFKRFKDDAAAFGKDMEDAKKTMDIIRLEIAAQNNIAGQTDGLKTELEQYIKNMSGTIDRINLIETEINRFDSQLAQIKRLEEDVNAKMTRFLAEKHRIEVMENDFTRLLQTSQSVEQKLAQVSSSDDLLQTMQVQLRHLEDAIKETEEKYKRVERKNKTIQETNDGIDRNFKALQENEQTVKRLDDTVSLLKTEMESIRGSIEALSAENEKARDAADKVSALDENIQLLEKRISEMNTARESLARLATELQNLEKKAKDQLKLVQSVLSRGEGETAGRKKAKTDEGAPTPRTRENAKKLKAQGWSNEEIANSLNLSKGEVELILELPSRDV